MKTLLLFTLAFTVFTFYEQPAEAASWRQKQAWCDLARENIKEGDLIFLDLPTKLYDKVESVSQSWASHVGIAMKDRRGRWVVYEQKPVINANPFKLIGNVWRRENAIPTKLCKYIGRAQDGQHAVLRLKGRTLSQSDLRKLMRGVRQEMQKLYDFSFDFDLHRKSYCSKLVWRMYRNIGVTVGRVQTFAELENNILDKNESRDLERWFTRFPWSRLTRNRGSVDWCRQTITPASQLRDRQFEVVYRRRANGKVDRSRDEFHYRRLPPSEKMRRCGR